jgi:hypothetical protein
MDLPFEEEPVSGLTEPAAAPVPACSAAATALVMPEKLDPALHEGALRIVGKVPAEIQQDLLDELAGHLGMPRKTIDNPLGWLSTLVQKAQDGSLVLTMAPVIAAARARRQKVAERLPALAPTACAPAAPDPEAAKRAEQARAKLRELRNGMVAKAAPAMAGMPGSRELDQSDPTHESRDRSPSGVTNPNTTCGACGVTNPHKRRPPSDVTNPNTGCGISGKALKDDQH